MKLVKSLLLGSAAGIVAVGSAVAADLPVRKAAPVDYVQVCSAFGTGYFYIPGTDTCLKVGGYVRYESRFNDTKWNAPGLNPDFDPNEAISSGNAFSTDRVAGRDRSRYSQFIRGNVTFDARTATEFGTLRSFISMFVEPDSTSLYHGYIEFAGLTVGQTSSYFRGIGSPSLRGGMWMPENPAPLAAYTIDAGAFSATISAEENRALLPSANATYSANDLSGDAETIGWNLRGASAGMPDFVGSMRFDMGDVTVTAAGVLAPRRFNFDTNANATDNDAISSIPGTKYGYALTAGVQFQIAPTTSFGIQGAYASGANAYTGIADAGTTAAALATRRFTLPVADAYRDVNGSVKLSESWVLNARVDHQWAPNITQSVFGAYGEFTAPRAARGFAAGNDDFNNGNAFAGSGVPNSYTMWGAGTVVSWAPVAGLTVAGEVNYRKQEAKTPVLTNFTGGDVVTSKSQDRWTATLRIQRNF